MGEGRQVRRLHTTVALALVLALAGSTSPAARTGTSTQGPPSPPDSALVSQPVPASVTVVDASSSRRPSPTPQPAIHIAATGTPGSAATVRADVANLLLKAYRAAATGAPSSCHLPVSLLAAIGEVESGSLVGQRIDSRHRTALLGPVLDGHGFAAVPDTDGGRWDGNRTWDRAMGPMQFIPSTWRAFAVDGDRDGVRDPQDVEDASATTAAYLCYGGRDLARPAVLGSAVLAYNSSTAYQQQVLTYQQRYARQGLDRGVPVVGLAVTLSSTRGLVVGHATGPVTAPVTGPVTGPGTGRVPGDHTPRPATGRDAKATSTGAGSTAARTQAQATPRTTATLSPSTSGTPKRTEVSSTKPSTKPTTKPTTTPTATPRNDHPGTDPACPPPPTGSAADDPITSDADTPADATNADCPPCSPAGAAVPADVPADGADAADSTDPGCPPCSPSDVTGTGTGTGTGTAPDQGDGTALACSTEAQAPLTPASPSSAR